MDADFLILTKLRKLNNTDGLRALWRQHRSPGHLNISPIPNQVHNLDAWIRELNESIVSPTPPLMSLFDVPEEDDEVVIINEVPGKEFIVISDSEKAAGDEPDQDMIFIEQD